MSGRGHGVTKGAVMNLSVFLARRVGVAFLAIFTRIAPTYGQNVSQVLVEVLRKCGDNLTYRPIKKMFLIRLDGRSWAPEGNVIRD